MGCRRPFQDIWQSRMNGVTFDAGGLIAIEKGRYEVAALAQSVLAHGDWIAIPALALAQVWRNGAKQVRLARFLALRGVEVVHFTDESAKRVGELCGVANVSDVVDVSVVWCARKYRHKAVVTSDPIDIARIDQTLRLIVV